MNNEQPSETPEVITLDSSQNATTTTAPATPTLNGSPACSTGNTSASSLHCTSGNVTQTQTVSACCGDFIEALNKPINNITVTLKFLTCEKNTTKNKDATRKVLSRSDKDDEANLSGSSSSNSCTNEIDHLLNKKIIINRNLNESDIVSYLNYCNTWPQR